MLISIHYAKSSIDMKEIKHQNQNIQLARPGQANQSIPALAKAYADRRMQEKESH
jgi:hypothetical protein